MKKIFLDWGNCTIIETEDINNSDVGASIKFIDKQQMLTYFSQHKNAFKNVELYERVSDLNSNIAWKKIEINSIEKKVMNNL